LELLDKLALNSNLSGLINSEFVETILEKVGSRNHRLMFSVLHHILPSTPFRSTVALMTRLVHDGSDSS
jgi:hypothetical protein